jgi:hypothetical protein
VLVMAARSSLSDKQLVELLQRYLTVLQGHPSGEEMMDDR